MAFFSESAVYRLIAALILIGKRFDMLRTDIYSQKLRQLRDTLKEAGYSL